MVTRENKSSELFLSCWFEFLPIVTAWDKAGKFESSSPKQQSEAWGIKALMRNFYPEKCLILLHLLPTCTLIHISGKPGQAFSPSPAKHGSYIWNKSSGRVSCLYHRTSQFPFALTLKPKALNFVRSFKRLIKLQHMVATQAAQRKAILLHTKYYPELQDRVFWVLDYLSLPVRYELKPERLEMLVAL